MIQATGTTEIAEAEETALSSGAQAGSGTVLQADGIVIRYGRRTVLEGVTLGLEAGSVYALLGRNGSGKTSLVRCLLGVQRPTAGRVRLFGRDPWSERASLMRRVGVMPEVPDAPPTMTAGQLLRFCGRLSPHWDGSDAAARLRRFDVPLTVPFKSLSKGQKGQVSLALALAHRPELLILDDPTLGLDPLMREAVFGELIGELADRGSTVLVVTQDLAGVEGLADRVGILEAGCLKVDEPMEGLKARVRRLTWRDRSLASAARQALEAMAPLAVQAKSWGTEAVVAAFEEDRRLALEAAGAGTVEVATLTLTEIFVALVGGESHASEDV